MAHELNRKRPEDARFINLTDNREIEYWVEILEVTEKQLRTAVANVGKGAEKVKQYLGR